jgi:hypothetical protein
VAVATGGALFDPLAELHERVAEIDDEIYRPWPAAAADHAVASGVGGPQSRAADLGRGTGRFA